MSRSSADYLRVFRERMKEQGFIKKEVYIPPQYANVLKDVEKALREGIIPSIPRKRKGKTFMNWNIESLLVALKTSDVARNGKLQINLVNDTAIEVIVEDVNEFPAYITISGNQILVVTTLFPVAAVGERVNEVNYNMLRANPLMPLSDFAIIGDNYVLFGALSVESHLEEIVTEIITLADNVIDALGTFATI